VFTDFDFDVIQRSFVYLFRDGMTFTLTLTALAMTGGIIFGTLLAMLRLSSFAPLSALAGGYVNLMRSLPLVLVIFWFFFLVPWIGGWLAGTGRNIQVGAFWSAVITFTMFEAAYYCEIMRAGIQSIPRGQVAAGQALGLNYWQTMGLVVLPQVRHFRHRLPRRRGQGRQPRLPAGRDVPVRRAGVFRHQLRRLAIRQAPAGASRRDPLGAR
jgi:glutamate/aspartate transport system permease protein